MTHIAQFDFVPGLPNTDLHAELQRASDITALGKRKPGRRKVEHSLFQLIVHEDATGSHLHTQHGPVKLGAWMADFVRRRAEVVPFARPADEDGTTPTGLVRRIRARDDGHCQNCQAVIHLHVHHVVFRAHGGKTNEANLLCVCTRCHAMIHQGLLHIVGDGGGGWFFLDNAGRAVERSRNAAAGQGPCTGGRTDARIGGRTGARTSAREVRLERSGRRRERRRPRLSR